MRIEIIDRTYWLNIVNRKLDNLYAAQQREFDWYDGLPWYKQWFKEDPRYPAEIYWWSETIYKELIGMFKSKGTGVIYLDYEYWFHLKDK